jgi:hypothetical protein
MIGFTLFFLKDRKKHAKLNSHKDLYSNPKTYREPSSKILSNNRTNNNDKQATHKVSHEYIAYVNSNLTASSLTK